MKKNEEFTRKMDSIVTNYDKTFLNKAYSKSDFDAKLRELKKYGNAPNKCEVLRDLYDMFAECGVKYDEGEDISYYAGIVENMSFSDYKQLENEIMNCLFDEFKDYPDPAAYMERNVNRLEKDEDTWERETLRLRILKQFLKYGNGLAYGKKNLETGRTNTVYIYGGKDYIYDYVSKKTKQEKPTNEQVIKELDDGVFDVLIDARSEEKKPKAKYGILKMVDDIAGGKFRMGGTTKTALYLLALAYDMTFYFGREEEIMDSHRDIVKNLFEDYYTNNVMRYIMDSYRNHLGEFEVEPSGQGINYKNFAEMVYVYYIYHKDFPKNGKERLLKEIVELDILPEEKIKKLKAKINLVDENEALSKITSIMKDNNLSIEEKARKAAEITSSEYSADEKKAFLKKILKSKAKNGTKLHNLTKKTAYEYTDDEVNEISDILENTTYTIDEKQDLLDKIIKCEYSDDEKIKVLSDVMKSVFKTEDKIELLKVRAIWKDETKKEEDLKEAAEIINNSAYSNKIKTKKLDELLELEGYTIEEKIRLSYEMITDIEDICFKKKGSPEKGTSVFRQKQRIEEMMSLDESAFEEYVIDRFNCNTYAGTFTYIKEVSVKAGSDSDAEDTGNTEYTTVFKTFTNDQHNNEMMMEVEQNTAAEQYKKLLDELKVVSVMKSEYINLSELGKLDENRKKKLLELYSEDMGLADVNYGLWFTDMSKVDYRDEIKSVIKKRDNMSEEEYNNKLTDFVDMLYGVNNFMKVAINDCMVEDTDNNKKEATEEVDKNNVTRTRMLVLYYYYYNAYYENISADTTGHSDGMGFRMFFEDFKRGADKYLEDSFYQHLSLKNILDVIIVLSAYARLSEDYV